MKYQHIITDIIQQIENNQLRAKDKLPSIRQLSKDYSCTKETVQKALAELKHLNYIYPVAKSGYYVLGQHQDAVTDISLPLDQDSSQAYEDFRLCLNESLIGRENHLFNYYGKQEGLDELVQAVQKQLVAGDVYCKPEQVVITAGTQQALYILSQLEAPAGKDHILLEQPTYHRMNELVTSLQLPYATIDRTFDGIDLKELEQLFQSGKFRYFYTIPRLHMPLGVRYSLAEKQAIVDLAQRYGVYIIEDDYMADLDTTPAPPLHYYDTHSRVIYIKSYSASIFPALRMAGLALPKDLVAPFLNYKQLMDYDANLIIQQALALYLTNGLFDKNSRLLRQHSQENRRRIAALLADTPLPTPYQLTHKGLVFLIPKHLTPAQLKQSGLPLDLLESNYVTTNSYTYAHLVDSPRLEQDLQTIKLLLEK